MSITRTVDTAPSDKPPRFEDAPFGPRPPRVVLVPGARLGRYEVLAPLGMGGMAQVWLAEQVGELGFRKFVALKAIIDEYAANPQVRKMFLEEARIASRIRHANAVDVLDLGERDDKIFLAMEFIEGASLGSVLSANGALPTAIAARVVLDALHGLHAAHELRDDDGIELGLVHRDVSPHNVLLGVDGISKIADFGIAKALGRVTDVTESGQWKGKVRYAAPEQIYGLPLTRTADVFSMGIVLWEALTGRALFKSAERQFDDRPRDPRLVAPDIPPPIADVVMRALAMRPADRFRSALEMAEALEPAGRNAHVLASHTEVAETVKKAMGPALTALRDVMRARRRGEPLPAYGGLSAHVASGSTLPVQSKPRRGRSRVLLGSAVAFVAVVTVVTVARTADKRAPRASTPALPSAGPAEPPSASPLAVVATPSASQAAPSASAVSAPRPRALSPEASSTERKAPHRPAANASGSSKVPHKAGPQKHDSTSDRPTFDNPYE